MTDEAMLPDGSVVTIQQVRVMDTIPPLRCAGADDADVPCERPLRVRALTSKFEGRALLRHPYRRMQQELHPQRGPPRRPRTHGGPGSPSIPLS